MPDAALPPQERATASACQFPDAPRRRGLRLHPPLLPKTIRRPSNIVLPREEEISRPPETRLVRVPHVLADLDYGGAAPHWLAGPLRAILRGQSCRPSGPLQTH